MKPTNSGWYWLKQNWKDLVTGEIKQASWEVCFVCFGLKPRQRKGPQCLIVCTALYGGLRFPISDCPDYWEWSGPISEPNESARVTEKGNNATTETST